MTKFTLHGGSLGNESKANQKFYQEVTQDLPEQANILAIYFAREENEIPNLIQQDEARFQKSSPKINFIIAEKSPEKLTQQIQKSHAIFMSGGSELNLRKYLQQIDFPKLIQGKTISGSSAGANIIAQSYFTNDRNQTENGFGIIPIKTICHFTGENKKLEALKNHEKNLPIQILKDEEFITTHY